MKKLIIKVDLSFGKIKPQLEFGPYDTSDCIAKALVSAMDYNVIQKLYDEKRLEVVELDEFKGTVIYKYS